MHKHAHLIRALADNASLVIQLKQDDDDDSWVDVASPAFDCTYSEYRIKPSTIPQPHRHADLLRELADNPNIKFEYRLDEDDTWTECKSVSECYQMRIKESRFPVGSVVQHERDRLLVVVTKDTGGDHFSGTCFKLGSSNNDSILYIPDIEWVRQSFSVYA